MRFASGSTMSGVTTAVGGIAEAEADAANAAVVQPLQFGVGDSRDAGPRRRAHCGAELRDRVERDLVVGGVVARRDDDDARGADALLQQPVVRDRRVRGRDPVARRHRKARGIVDVHVAVGGVRRAP